MLYWQLLDMCLECFPPSEDFENFLEAFIRQRYDTDARLRKLHVILYVGRQTGKTPTDAQVRSPLRQQPQGTEGAVRSEEERFTR